LKLVFKLFCGFFVQKKKLFCGLLFVLYCSRHPLR